MTRPLDARLGRVEERRQAAGAANNAAAARQRRLWRAEAAIGGVIREALAASGVDPASVACLALADQAQAALAAIPDTADLERADREVLPPVPMPDRAGADAFVAKIAAMARAAAGAPPPDFARASFAELFAWSLAQSAGQTRSSTAAMPWPTPTHIVTSA